MSDTTVGYVEGYKVLRYNHFSGTLFSPVKSYYEWDCNTATAECSCYMHHERPGSADGDCGFYATKNPKELNRYTSHPYKANFPYLAKVRGYGTVTEGDDAWRSEHMEITELYPLIQFPGVRLIMSGIFLLLIGLSAATALLFWSQVQTGWMFLVLFTIFVCCCGSGTSKLFEYAMNRNDAINITEINGIPVTKNLKDFTADKSDRFEIRLFLTRKGVCDDY